MRDGNRRITSLPRVGKCGRVSVMDGGSVLLRGPGGDGRAAFGGLHTCGSVHACPVCSAKVASRRAEEITEAVRWNVERGGSVALLTLTMRHHRGQPFEGLKLGLSKGWNHITGARGFKAIRAELGLDGYIRGFEATHGEQGWHLHYHALLFFDGPVTYDECRRLEDEIWERWSAGLRKAGMSAERGPGIDLRIGEGALETLGQYLNKLAFETAGGRFKKGRRGGRSPFEILKRAIESDDPGEVRLWNEWEQGSKGMRQIYWSPGFKARVGVGEVDDETLAAEQDPTAQTIAELPARSWKQIYAERLALLEATERGGWPAAFAWLIARDVAFEGDDPTGEYAIWLSRFGAREAPPPRPVIPG